ncbi:PE_PGRS family protein [Mycobacterium tuberculosis str. Erdman = ATCC 35801]|nr:PE_PGRS family protein [Mycobacterium tuberculosis str. Erdman = ATCC 35801]
MIDPVTNTVTGSITDGNGPSGVADQHRHRPGLRDQLQQQHRCR